MLMSHSFCVMLNVVILNVIKLSNVMLSAMAPITHHGEKVLNCYIKKVVKATIGHCVLPISVSRLI